MFLGNLVLLTPYDGFTKPSTIELNMFKIWIHIHDLPDGFSWMVKSLASKVGELVTAETQSNDFSGNFFRARMLLDVRNPLENVVSIVFVKYERLPDWCTTCDMIDRLFNEHSDDVHPPSFFMVNGCMHSGEHGRGHSHGSGRD